MSTAEPAIRIESLSKTYAAGGVPPKLALDDVSLDIERGQIFGLLGPNGAGKSTLINILAGLVVKSSGRATIWGFDIDAHPRNAKRSIGIVPQEIIFDPFFTPREALEIQAGLYGIPPKERKTMELLAAMHLTDKAEAYARTLSGGMKRRLTLARALINDPELLILDEPTTGLDPQARHLIWDGLRQLLSQGKTILLTTHFMDEAERLASRLAVIDHGALIASDTPRTLIATHVEPEVVEVYGDDAKAWAEAHGRRLATRLELSGETAFAYSDNAKPLLDDLATRSGVRYLHRPANLEDLFIKLTGRELRD